MVKSLGSAVLAATIGLAGCGEEPYIAPEPTPHQLQVVKNALLADFQKTDDYRRKAFETLQKQSLDGAGRISYSKDTNVITIHVEKPRLQLVDSYRRNFDDQQLTAQFKSTHYDLTFRGDKRPVTDENITREIVVADSRVFHDDGIRFNEAAGYAVVNVASGRVCIQNAAHKEDCLNKKDVQPDTQLGRDIKMAYRALGL